MANAWGRSGGAFGWDTGGGILAHGKLAADKGKWSVQPTFGSFIIRTDDQKDIRFEANFGDGAPLVTDGYGGWTVTARPKNIGFTEWAGRNPMAIEIPFLLDYFPDGTDDEDAPGIACEAMVDKLEQISGIGSGDHPPICWVQGHGVIPHDYTNSPTLRWVIENIQWSREVEVRAHNGRRLRCGGTITIRQFKDPDVLDRVGRKKSKTTTKPIRHKVRKGETLSTIARDYYHDASKWRVIADANNIRDRRSIKVGQVLLIP